MLLDFIKDIKLKIDAKHLKGFTKTRKYRNNLIIISKKKLKLKIS